MPNFNEDVLEPFLTMARPGEWKGHDLANFSSRFSTPVGVTEFDQLPLTRSLLKQASLKPENEVPSLWFMRATLAWGGLRYAAVAGVEKREAEIVSVVSSMRKGNLSRQAAYREFIKVGLDGPFGLGPAYYTKLIFFACPEHDGYIMDQWTAKSANMLSLVPIVKLDGNRVSPRNSDAVYESFCLFVEALAERSRPHNPQVSGEYVEECMFAGSKRHGSADGTNGRLPWRNFVRLHWRT